MEMFTSGTIERPWFKTLQHFDNGSARVMTQDLYFCEKARKAGYRFAVDSRVKVGHFCPQTKIVW
jgi:GT2 family glycosyltransferase